jgi:hypothetical protein
MVKSEVKVPSHNIKGIWGGEMELNVFVSVTPDRW